MDRPMPLVFLSHGSPMNAIEDNPLTRALVLFGDSLPRPKAILCVSAHWETELPCLSSSSEPPMIYDFFGFPQACYRVSWLPPGAPDLANRTKELLAAWDADLDPERGLDHGAWTVLMRLFPKADVPVVQLSLSHSLNSAGHVALARALAPLRSEGILVAASGNCTHNLGEVSWTGEGEAPGWARDFDRDAKAAFESGELAFFERAVDLSRSGRLRAHPTADHLLPMLYAAALALPGEKPQTIFDGWQNGSLSMRSVAWGA